ncbi:MAG: thiamine-monophosphate kinase [Verrucomicrobiales bacterium]|nr:thiamine-monophosphate kinase [Verrucomicrobiales bacterium]
MNEFELIARLTAHLPTNAAVVTGPGDDCALVDLGIPDRWVVFKTDAVVEGVHFTKSTEPGKVGHKALARVLSDFAAAAATPVAALVTLGLPRAFDAGWVEEVYRGLRTTAERWNVAIVGGETTTNPDRTLLSVSAIGTVARDRVVRRSGARPGDGIFVSGTLGGSSEGHHLDFVPRLAEAAWLTENFEVHAMIDLSDGLAGDLRHLLRASGVGAELLQDAIPISRAARLNARTGDAAKPPLLAALTDGEDFELLFTVPARSAVPVLDGWKARFPETPLACIGRIVEVQGLRLRDDKGVREAPVHGYVHFT